MNRKTITRVAGAAPLALSFGLALGAPAQARTPAPASTGMCSATSTAMIHASEHKKGVKVTVKIKTGRAGEAWDWLVFDNSNTVVTGQNARGTNGKLVIRETIPNLEGTDTIDFYASDEVTAEVCEAETIAR